MGEVRTLFFPWSAKALDSVPPEVNRISCGSHPKQSAIALRLSSKSALAQLPAPCKEEGLPTTSMASAMAALAAGCNGVVAA